MRFSRSAVRLACEIIKKGVLTREELEAILRSGTALKELAETALLMIYKGTYSCRRTEAGKHDEQAGEEAIKEKGNA